MLRAVYTGLCETATLLYMALHIRQNDKQSELQKRIAAEMQDKAKNKPADVDFDPGQPDGIDDSRYIEGTKQTTSLAWVWVLIAIAAIGIVLWLVIASTTNG